MFEKKFFTVLEFSKIVNCNPCIARNNLRAGRWRGIRTGGPLNPWAIPNEEIERILANGPIHAGRPRKDSI